MLFQSVQILYWLALSTWFGGVLFIAIAAPVVFRTVRESDPLLPTVLSVNLDGQHGTLLAGSIVANLLKALQRIELICAAGLFAALCVQWFLVDRSVGGLFTSILRTVLYLAAVGIVLYDWLSLSPHVWRHRQDYLDNADDPDIANPAKERFDRSHRESVALLTTRAAALLGIILFSANLSPFTTTIRLLPPTTPEAAGLSPRAESEVVAAAAETTGWFRSPRRPSEENRG